MKQKKKHRFLRFLLLLAVLWFALPYLNPLLRDLQVRQLSLVEVPEWVDVQIIPVDGTSRRGEKLTDIQNIVIHYVANPGTTALQNRNWYENPESEVSSHFVIGLEGEVIQCIPLN
jgi:N-acetylmuramoyl-L-alanine amidase